MNGFDFVIVASKYLAGHGLAIQSAIAIGVICILGWLHWDRLRRLPGGSWLEQRLRQPLLPSAGGQQFCVSVTALENDDGNTSHLLTHIMGDVPGVEILQVQRTFAISGNNLQRSVAKGHEWARRILRRTNAHVVVWGTVIVSSGAQHVRLFLTDDNDEQSSERGSVGIFRADLDLPPVLVEKMRCILIAYAKMKVIYSLKFAESGDLAAQQNDIDQLSEIVKAGPTLWGPYVHARMLAALGKCKGFHAQDINSQSLMADAIATLREAHAAFISVNEQREAHFTCSNLSLALSMEATLSGNQSRLPEAVALARESERHLRSESGAYLRLNNLGIALFQSGQVGNDKDLLVEALDHFAAAEKSLESHKWGLNIGMIRHNTGCALYELGRMECGTERLEQAAEAFEEAASNSKAIGRPIS